MKTVLRGLVILAAAIAGVVILTSTYFAARALARERPAVKAGTVHDSLGRESCIDCHAPIAAEWRQSFHARTVTGPFWDRIRREGYADMFRMLRVPCMNCHAPANVLDLRKGAPVQRSDAPELGVDCVSCHVSEHGIAGPGRLQPVPHDVVVDPRFRDPAAATMTLCSRCHDEECEKTVTDWRGTRFAREGTTCLHCHMPEVEAPSVAGGPPRHRRSHRFAADKDRGTLLRALNATLEVPGNRTAIVRIVNDRVGHAFPGSGMNEVIVQLTARGLDGSIARTQAAFGTRELIPGYLDFWPFRRVTKIPPGASRVISVGLPSEHGEIAATFRYRDWWVLSNEDLVIRTLNRTY